MNKNILSPNDKTIEVYNHQIAEYIQKTPNEFTPAHAPLLRWIDFALNSIPSNGIVLEIGSGPGRDARYIQDKGVEIQCSDAAKGFVDYINKQVGLKATQFNVLKDTLDTKYDLVFANSVTQHFTYEDQLTAFKKIHDLLKPGGVFAFSAKQGRGEVWTNEKLSEKRFIRYDNPTQLNTLIDSFGFKTLFFEDGIKGDLPSHVLIHLVVKKV